MTTRVALSDAQREQIALGRFVRVHVQGGLRGDGKGVRPGSSGGAAAHSPSPLVAGDSARSVLVGRVDGEWRAYVNECRHRALPLDLGASSPMSEDGEHLLCHQHGALYRRRDGMCVLGPCAGEKLTPVAVARVVEDGAELLLAE
jgi:nitrite reductase/ring-hydroxylating ferredoxin subunit